MMNERWGDNDLPADRQVAYFIKLHPDTAIPKEKHPHKTGEWIYSVDGKARPMLVIRRLSKRKRGVCWFLVLPITTKGRDGSGALRTDVERLYNCIEADKESFVEMRPHWLPENLFDGSIVKPCNEFAFVNALKIVHHKLFRTEDQATWVRFID